MRQISYVEKKELLEVYGDGLEVFMFTNALAGSVKTVTTFLEDQIEVIVRQNNGPFTICEVRQMGGDHRIIVPNNLIKKGDVEEAREKFKPLLDKRFPGLWYWPTADETLKDDGSLNPTWIDHDLILIYPEINITNSLGHKHKLYNMLVKLTITVDGGIHRIMGARASLTRDEVTYNYRHSHIHSQSNGKLFWDDFCLGSGTMRNMIDKMKKPNSVFEFSLFLDQLKAYLEWESLEGTPYISIRNIGLSDGGMYFDAELSMEPSTSTTVLATEMIRLLLRPEHQECLTWYGDFYLIDPTNDVALLKVERAIIEKAMLRDSQTSRTLQRILRDYDLMTNSYQLTAPSATSTATVEYVAADIAMVGKVFNLPKLIQPEEPVKEVKRDLIKRLATNKMEWVIKEANSILINGRYKVEA